MVPWERYQTLLNLEKKVLNSEDELENSLIESNLCKTTVNDCNEVNSTEISDNTNQALESDKSETHYRNDDQFSHSELEENEKQQRQFQHQIGEGDKSSIEKDEVPLLLPPGLPARRWLIWK